MPGRTRRSAKVTRLGIIQRTIVSFGDDFTFKSHGRDGLHQILRGHCTRRRRLHFGRVGIERDTHRFHSRHTRERFFDRAAAPAAHHGRGNLEILDSDGCSHGQMLSIPNKAPVYWQSHSCNENGVVGVISANAILSSVCESFSTNFSLRRING
jgi:hypothetical protein